MAVKKAKPAPKKPEAKPAKIPINAKPIKKLIGNIITRFKIK